MHFYFYIGFGLPRKCTRLVEIASWLLRLLWNYWLVQIFLLLRVQLIPFSLLLCFLVVTDVKSFSPSSWSLRKRCICSIICWAHKTALIMLIAVILYGTAHFRSLPYQLTLIWLFYSSIWVKSLRYLNTTALIINFLSACIVEIIGRISHFYIAFVYTTAAIISIRILLMIIILLSMVNIRLLLVFNWATLMMRCHVLPSITRRICELDATIVVRLQTWLLVERIFETDAIVGNIGLFITCWKCSSYTLWNLVTVRRTHNHLISTIWSVWMTLQPSCGLKSFVWICIEILECLPQIYEFSAITGARLHLKVRIILAIGGCANLEFELCFHLLVDLLLILLLLGKVIAILVPVFLFINFLFIFFFFLLFLIHEWISAGAHCSRWNIQMISLLSIRNRLINYHHAAIVGILISCLLSGSQLAGSIASTIICLLGLGNLRSTLGLHILSRLGFIFFQVNFFLSDLRLIIGGVCLRRWPSLFLSVDPLK